MHVVSTAIVVIIYNPRNYIALSLFPNVTIVLLQITLWCCIMQMLAFHLDLGLDLDLDFMLATNLDHTWNILQKGQMQNVNKI